MEDLVPNVIHFAVAHKWWLIACIPIALAVIVVRFLNPR